MGWDYAILANALTSLALPAMLVDLDALTRNAQRLATITANANKTLRIATKSVRVPALLERLQQAARDTFKGLMCFSAREAAFLAGEGFDDLLLAYPVVEAGEISLLDELTQAGVRVTAMVDCDAHLRQIEAQWRGPKPLATCVDLDMSNRLLGNHLGVQRSPIRDLAALEALLSRIVRSQSVRFHGVMGYEAQIAGLTDIVGGSPVESLARRAFKRWATQQVSERRGAIAELLKRLGLTAAIFNGGGSGSVRSTSREPWITEITAGSGFFQSHLFDRYRENQNEPALCFALRVTRQPEPGVVTCHSGGFIASGEIAADKAPVPFLPAGLVPFPHEGFGEVQTPLRLPPGLSIPIGAPVLFRPAKAGEIAERFERYYLLRENRIVGEVPTYRGRGQCFF